MTQKSITKIAITDDHALFIEGISSLLDQVPGIEVAATALSGEETLKMLETQDGIDVLLTDISMQDIDGIELCRRIKKSFPKTQVIALSMHDEPRIISAMLKAGASGYLLKKTNKDELLRAISTVREGGHFISEQVTSKMVELFNPQLKKSASILPQLSEREKQVLRLVAKAYTTPQIAERLFISSHTVISHRKKLLLKFNTQNTAGLILKASEFGFLDEPIPINGDNK